jgi:hypothetical protein
LYRARRYQRGQDGVEEVGHGGQGDARPGGRQQTRTGVAAIETPGESSLKTCGCGRVSGEQVDEEMTLRPPCPADEACDSQSVETGRELGDCSVLAGFGAVVECQEATTHCYCGMLKHTRLDDGLD